jgi:hypothetical protein
MHSIEALYSGKEIVEDVDGDILSTLYQPPFELPAERLLRFRQLELVPNKYFILRHAAALG